MIEQTKTGIKYTGFYRGKVLEHGSGGKCKIFWPSVNPSDWEYVPDKLPYAEQAAPLFASSPNEDGLFFYPEIGSIVWGFFENGDVNFPVYFASFIGTESNSVNNYGLGGISAELKKEASDEASPINENKSYKTALLKLGSLEILMNGEQNSIEIRSNIDSAESTISIGKDGITLKSNKRIMLDGQNLSLHANQLVFINGEIGIIATGGGVDETGSRKPGFVSLYGNSVASMSNGGGSWLIGNSDAKVAY